MLSQKDMEYLSHHHHPIPLLAITIHHHCHHHYHHPHHHHRITSHLLLSHFLYVQTVVYHDQTKYDYTYYQEKIKVLKSDRVMYKGEMYRVVASNGGSEFYAPQLKLCSLDGRERFKFPISAKVTFERVLVSYLFILILIHHVSASNPGRARERR